MSIETEADLIGFCGKAVSGTEFWVDGSRNVKIFRKDAHTAEISIPGYDPLVTHSVLCSSFRKLSNIAHMFPPSFFIPLPVVAHAVVLRHGKFFFLSKCKYFVWNKQKVWYYSLTTTQQQKINDCFCVFTSTAPWYPKLPQIGNNEINQKRWSCRAFFGIFCSFYSWCKWQRPAPCPLSLCCINYLQLVQDSTAQNWIPILLNFEIKILTAQSWILGSAFRSLCWASFMILKYLLLETPSILPYKLLHIVDVDI